MARIPHAFNVASGASVEGTRRVALCAECDRNDPDAQGVLAFFAVHETIVDDILESAAALIYEWVRRVLERQSDDGEVERVVAIEYERWIDGEL